MSKPLLIGALAALFLLGLLPLFVLAGGMGLEDLARLAEGRTLSLLGRTFALGLGAAGLAFALGLPFGFFVARTDMPGSSWMRPLGAVPLFLPTLLLAVAWAPLVELRGGLAAALILGISTFPLVAIFTARACERIDAGREEAALLVGGLGAVVRMELPLVLPAALAATSIAFAFAVNDYATPDYVSSVGPKFNVYADEVFASWGQLQEPGRALAVALPLILLTLLTLLPALSLRRRGALATLDSTFRTPAPLALGRLKIPALLFCLVPLTLGVFVPMGRLLFEAAKGPSLVESGTFGVGVIF